MAEPANAQRPDGPALHRRAWLLAAAFFLALLVAGATGVSSFLRHDARQALQEVKSSCIANVDVLHQSLLRTLEAIQGVHALQQTRHDLAKRGKEGGAEAIQDYLATLAARESFGILQFAATDAAGTVNFSTVPNWAPISLRDREHVTVHFNRAPALFVSEPLVGRVSGRWSVQFSYPLHDEAGRFDGVSVVSLDPIILSNQLRDVIAGDRGVVGLLRLRDGALLARSRDADQQLDRPASATHPALVAAQSAPRGMLRTTSPVDGRDVIMCYRRVPEGEMVLAFAQDLSVVLDAARSFARWAWASFGLVMLLVLVAMLASLRAAGLRATRRVLARVEAEATATATAWARMEQLLEAAPVAIYAGSIEGSRDSVFHTRFASPNLRRVIGWEPEVFSDPGEAKARMDASAWDARLAAHRTTLAEGRAVLEYRWLWPDGSWRWLREEARRVGGSGPDAIEIVGYLLDVTEQRQAEAWAAASARLNMLGELAANMAHELNQPLAVISLAAENASAALEEDGLGGVADAMATLELVSAQATRCKAVMQHLRMFSSPDQRQAIGPVRLEGVVQGAMLLVRGALRDAGIMLHTHLPDGLPAILANPVGAEQVFVNLLLNARDVLAGLAPGLPRDVWIGATIEEDSLRVSVTDSGGGIPPDLLGRVFEPFFTTKGSDKGTGLGLAICQATMRGFGGEISVANGPLGARFTLEFPLVVPEDAVDAA